MALINRSIERSQLGRAAIGITSASAGKMKCMKRGNSKTDTGLAREWITAKGRRQQVHAAVQRENVEPSRARTALVWLIAVYGAVFLGGAISVVTLETSAVTRSTRTAASRRR